MGKLRADLWYLRQVTSFAPRCASGQRELGKTLLLVSVFTSICACWLADMEWLLQHPGYLPRLGVDVSIALTALATILVRLLHLGVRVERWLWGCAVALIGIAVHALIDNARSAHFEGFVLLISLVLMLQGILMLLSLGRADGSSHPLAHGSVGSP